MNTTKVAGKLSAIIFALNVLVTLFAIPTGSRAQNANGTGSNTNFQELPFRGGETFLQVNKSGTLLAVMHGGQLRGEAYTGTSLEVWSLDALCKPQKLLYSDTRKIPFSPQVRWVGDNLLYAAIEGISLQKFMKELPLKPLETAEHVKGYVWQKATRALKSFAAAREPFLVPIDDLNEVVVINPVLEILQHIVWSRSVSPQSHVMPNPNLQTVHGVPICIYSVPDGKLLRRVVVPVRAPRILGDSSLIPLFVTADGSHLFATAYTDDPWKQTKDPLTPYDFLISIDIKTGTVTRLTSVDEPDALWINRRHFYGLGLPVRVGPSQVACSLNAPERNLDYRFQYFDAFGTLIKEVRVNDRVVQRAGIPKQAVPVSWDSKGNALLQAKDGLWMFDIAAQKGHELIKNIIITDVCGRSDRGNFLVRVTRLKGQSALDAETAGASNTTRDSIWGFIKTK